MAAYNWNWAVLVSEPYLGWLLKGVVATVTLALSSWVIALVLGSLIGLARTLPNAPLRWLATSYVELFRNIPLLVQMFLWFFVLPELVPPDFGHWLKRDLPYPEFYSAMVCLGLYTAVARCRAGTFRDQQRAAAAGRGGARFGHESGADVSPHTCCRSDFASSFRR